VKKFLPDELPEALAAPKKKGAKIRVRNIGPNALEHKIQVGVAGFLTEAVDHLDDLVWFAVPNGGARPGVTIEKNGVEMRFSKEGKKLREEGVKSGVSDIVILWRRRMICIEMKRKGTYQSETQEEFEQSVILAGGVYTVCRSVREVEDFLNTLGVPLAATTY
jgi:hypothetical protein